MKVIAFIGSAQIGHTYKITEQFLKNLQTLGNIDYEIIRLHHYKLGVCRGCRLCLDKGEELCPFRDDDRDNLISKIQDADGVVFASPNYSFHVSAIMKIFLDRLAFIFHRPRFFGKTFTSIVTQGITRGKDIVKYFNFIGKGFGFNVVKGSCVKTFEPMTEKGRMKIDEILIKQSKAFYRQLIKKEFPSPSLFWLMAFRMARTSMSTMLNEEWRDYNYYKGKGWFESDYFYPVKLNPVKKMTGKIFDKLAVKIIRS